MNESVNESELFGRTQYVSSLLAASIISVRQLDDFMKSLECDDVMCYELESIRDNLIDTCTRCLSLIDNEFSAITVLE